MKRLAALIFSAVMVFSLAACGKTNVSDVQETNRPRPAAVTPKREYDETDLAAVLGEITDDFADVTANLTQKLEETFAAVGMTYEDYQANKELITQWVTTALSESDALFARTNENSVTYFKLIAADEDHKYREFCDDTLEEYYDAVYDKAMDEYYDALYEDAMDDLYDAYYNGVIDDASDDVPYEEWSAASSACYKTWSEASSAIYKKWSGESSYIYGLWSAMNSAFCWDDNFDVDAIVAEYDQKKAEESAKKAAEEAKVYVDLDVLYAINPDGDAEVVGVSGEGNRITISSEYEGADVVRIADSAFADQTTLEKITIWADIEQIGSFAFKGCTGLTEFSVPSDTKIIGHHAFEGCTGLETLSIWGDPDIGEYAFADCVSLTGVSLGSDTKNVGAHAFEGCTGMTSLSIWGAEIIGDYAFSGCSGIESVSIPSDVLSVGNHAFDGCTALSSVSIWGDDTAIGRDAFANCPSLDDAPSARGTVLECTMRWDETGNNGADGEATAQDQGESTDAADGIRPEFQAAMDSYEAFYIEYCELMKQYSEDPADLTLLAKYADMLGKAQEMNEAFEAWNEDDLSAEELKYYLDVNNRVMKMLVDVAG